MRAQTFQEFSIPTAASDPTGIAFGFDGNMWFCETAANKIGRITPAGVITEFPIPTPASGTSSIANGNDTLMWFAQTAAGQIGRITTRGDFLIEIPVVTPVLPSLPRGIARGLGGSIAIGEAGGPPGYRIGFVANNAVVFHQALPGGNEDPFSIALGPGAMWFTEHGPGNKIGRIDFGFVLTEFAIPTPSSRPNGITYGFDTNMWFVEEVGKVARITESGVITEFSIPTPGSEPHSITGGPDGRVWFTENGVGKIGAIETTGGMITEYVIPTPNSRPEGIASDGHGRIWFTEQAANKIGSITLPPGAFQPIPTVSGGALVLIAALLAGTGFVLSRRSQ